MQIYQLMVHQLLATPLCTHELSNVCVLCFSSLFLITHREEIVCFIGQTFLAQLLLLFSSSCPQKLFANAALHFDE